MTFIANFNFGSLRRAAFLRAILIASLMLTLVTTTSLLGDGTNLSPLLQTNSVPTVGLPSSSSVILPLVRLVGALALIVALLFGAQWFVRNNRRLALAKSGAPRLNVLEVKSLGQRHSLYVIGYERQRILLATSPGGVSLLSQLPDATVNADQAPTPPVSFADTLMQTLGRR